MSDISLTIDGIQVSGHEGMTILEAVEQMGIHIPTLCHFKDLSPVGSCRICVVEVEGSARLVGACHTPIVEGMDVRTSSRRVLEARKTTLQLLLAGHTGPCVNDLGMADCELHQITDAIEAGPPPFKVRRPRFYPAEVDNPYIQRDMSKCILCHRCVRACREIAGHHILSVAYRGGDVKVVAGRDEPLAEEVCMDCDICVDYCPTTALSRKERPEKEEQAGTSGGEPQADLPDRDRGRLLGLLKDAQAETGYISPQFMEEVADRLGLSVGEVYGVATFYSFLSVQPQGKHPIRICKSMPCYFKHASLFIQGVKTAIGIAPGQTTPDGRFSFVLTNCIGACDQAPAMLVDDDLHGNLTLEKIEKILRSYD